MKDPRFVEIPEINPKTGKSPVFFICSVCGAIVASRKPHILWHRKHDDNLTFPYWEGIDDGDL